MDNSLEIFLEEVRDSCTSHAKRKGYMAGAEDVLGVMIARLGCAQDHAMGEIIAKLVEFKRTPRRVLATKIAGWAWRLWDACEEDKK